MKKRRNLAEIITKNRDKMRILHSVYEKIKQNPKLHEKFLKEQAESKKRRDKMDKQIIADEKKQAEADKQKENE